jgi:hypothetical protein
MHSEHAVPTTLHEMRNSRGETEKNKGSERKRWGVYRGRGGASNSPGRGCNWGGWQHQAEGTPVRRACMDNKTHSFDGAMSRIGVLPGLFDEWGETPQL